VTPLALFLSVFGVIFLAELPDKTAVAALVLATRNKALPVFTGTALALVVQSAVAVVAGRLFALLPPRPVHVVAGVVFIVSAGIMFFKKDDEDEGGEKDGKPAVVPTFLRTASTAFGVVFLAEWGDITQLGTAALAARYPGPRDSWIIFFSSALALCSAAGIAVAVGNRAARLLNPAIVQKIAAVLFAIVGVGLVFDVL
jgi:putative Ca2+/H+ antiporter (TMEM165/GDT1 family)